MNYYLKFKDQQDLQSALIAAKLAQMVDDRFSVNGSIALDIIGIIHKPTGVMLTNDDGFEYPETKPLSGYHANLLGELTQEQQELLPLVSEPKTPSRVWA